MTTTVPLDRLRFGHELGNGVNVRTTGREDGLDALKASLKSHGLIQPLAVSVNEADSCWYVADGNRRLLALQQMRDAGDIAVDHPVAVHERAAVLREASLAANVLRVALHPVDEYEAYASLADGPQKLTPQDIADRFGVPLKGVSQRLALGKLHPKIREAWRKGEIDRDAGQCAAAFTMARSLKEQEQVFDRLQKDGRLHPHTIRQQLGLDDGATKLLRVATREAYEAAGGKIIEDLFGDKHIVADPELVRKVADDRLFRELRTAIEDGWAWSSFANDLPSNWTWNWEKLTSSNTPTKAEKKRLKELGAVLENEAATEEQEAEGEAEIVAINGAIEERGWSDADKKRSGVVVSVGYHGEVNFTYGVVKPEPKKEASKGKEAKKAAKDPQISNAMMHRLSIALTTAVQKALPASPKVALAAVVAALATRGDAYGSGNPVRLRKEGFGAHESARDSEKFPDVFERMLAREVDELLIALANAMAGAIDMQSQNVASSPVEKSANAALFNALDAAALTAAFRETWAPADYFAGIAAPLVLRAIEEALAPGADEIKRIKVLKKKALAEYAAEKIPPTGWLPPELRTGHYVPPIADTKPARTSRKKAA